MYEFCALESIIGRRLSHSPRVFRLFNAKKKALHSAAGKIWSSTMPKSRFSCSSIAFRSRTIRQSPPSLSWKASAWICRKISSCAGDSAASTRSFDLSWPERRKCQIRICQNDSRVQIWGVGLPGYPIDQRLSGKKLEWFDRGCNILCLNVVISFFYLLFVYF